MTVSLPTDFQPADDELAGRVILITGATGALGRAAALGAARHGASVILLGRSVPRLEQLYDEIERAGGPQPAIVPLNLMTATWAEYEQLAAMVESEFGRLDGLLHAAAQFKAFTRLEDLEPREWLDALQVNLTAPYTLTRLLLPALRQSADASVVFVSDTGGRTPKPFHGAYGVSKAAAETLFATWAAELHHEAAGNSGLRFNRYLPAAFRSALRAKGYAGESDEGLRSADAALPALLWLLGRGSRGLTGQAL